MGSWWVQSKVSIKEQGKYAPIELIGASYLIGTARLATHWVLAPVHDSQPDRVKSSFAVAGLAGSCIQAGDKAGAGRSQDSMV